MSRIFCFNDRSTPEIYSLSPHSALPSSPADHREVLRSVRRRPPRRGLHDRFTIRFAHDRRAPCRSGARTRSEEHTSELQSRQYLVCRLLLEKKQTLDRAHYIYLLTTSAI